jgi:signal peptidase I
MGTVDQGAVMTKKRIFATVKLAATLLWWGALLLTVASVVVCLSAHFRGEVPRLFGYSVLHIVSDSMEPTIEQDSYILIKKCDPAEVGEDDIICFYSTDPQIYGYPNTHRVVAEPTVSDGVYQYVTQGDKANEPDRVPATGDRLIGVYVRTLGAFTAMMHFVTKNMILLFAAMFLFCAVTAFIPLFLKKDNGENRN